jgi:hypothetical protein
LAIHPAKVASNSSRTWQPPGIAKYTALRLAGVAADDLRIVIMHDTLNGEDHAVAAEIHFTNARSAR